jgi:hypothetical protein
MSDVFESLAGVVLAIRGDQKLKATFNRVLGIGSSTQQVRVATLLQELEKMEAPARVMNFVRLLSNDQLAQRILQEINK